MQAVLARRHCGGNRSCLRAAGLAAARRDWQLVCSLRPAVRSCGAARAGMLGRALPGPPPGDGLSARRRHTGLGASAPVLDVRQSSCWNCRAAHSHTADPAKLTSVRTVAAGSSPTLTLCFCVAVTRGCGGPARARWQVDSRLRFEAVACALWLCIAVMQFCTCSCVPLPGVVSLASVWRFETSEP